MEGQRQELRSSCAHLSADGETELGQQATCTTDSKSLQGGGHRSESALLDKHTHSASSTTSSAYAAPDLNALGIEGGVAQATRSKAKAPKLTEVKKEEENQKQEEAEEEEKENELSSTLKYRPIRQSRSALKQEPDLLDDDMTFQKIEGFLGHGHCGLKCMHCQSLLLHKEQTLPNSTRWLFMDPDRPTRLRYRNASMLTQSASSHIKMGVACGDCAVERASAMNSGKQYERVLADIRATDFFKNTRSKNLILAVNFLQQLAEAAANESVLAEKSLFSHCNICKKNDRPYEIILCDGIGCSKEYHMSCLRPKLKCVPESDWYGRCCVGTQRQQTARTPSTKSKKLRLPKDWWNHVEKGTIIRYLWNGKNNEWADGEVLYKGKGKPGENFFVTRFEPNIKLSVNLVEKSYEKLWTVSNWRGHKVPSSTESASIAKKRKQASKKSKAHHSRKAKAVKKESAQPTPTKPIHRRNKLSPDHPSLKTTAHGRVEGTSLLARKRRSALNAKGVATSADKPLSKRPHRVCKGAMGSGGGKAKNRPASGFVHAVQTTSQRWVPTWKELDGNSRCPFCTERVSGTLQKHFTHCTAARGAAIPNSEQLEQWGANFKRLQIFAASHGHTHVTEDFDDGLKPKLCTWVAAQREAYLRPSNTRQLSQIQIESLESLGFRWLVDPSATRGESIRQSFTANVHKAPGVRIYPSAKAGASSTDPLGGAPGHNAAPRFQTWDEVLNSIPMRVTSRRKYAKFFETSKITVEDFRCLSDAERVEELLAAGVTSRTHRRVIIHAFPGHGHGRARTTSQSMALATVNVKASIFDTYMRSNKNASTESASNTSASDLSGENVGTGPSPQLRAAIGCRDAFGQPSAASQAIVKLVAETSRPDLVWDVAEKVGQAFLNNLL